MSYRAHSFLFQFFRPKDVNESDDLEKITYGEVSKVGGRVTKYNDDCNYGGVCSIELGSSTIIIEDSEKEADGAVKGKIYNRPQNDDFVNKNMEAFVRKIDKENRIFTIYGRESFYVSFNEKR